MPKLICMIPARLGSKRIPKKNLRMFLGKPLLQHAIEKAKSASSFSSVWVNSESEEIGFLAKKLGVNFHQRPEQLSSDGATNEHFTYEFLEKHACDWVVMLNSTSPLLKEETIHSFLDFLNLCDSDTVFSVIHEKAESFFQNKPINFPLDKKINSQLLEPIQKVVWALTAWKREAFIQAVKKKLCPTFAGKIELFQISKEESVDIDEEEDWVLAEEMSKRNMKKIEAQYWNQLEEGQG